MTILTLADLRRVDQMDLEAENRALREALEEARHRALMHGYMGLAHFIGVTMMEIDEALRAPERPAEQILEERFPYLKDSRRP
jgi:hypothetical protein